MSRFRTGLVVGKFAPLHLGHEWLIACALSRCDHVVLLSYSNPEYPGCEPERRVRWLAARFPQTTRLVLSSADDALPLNTASPCSHRAFSAEVLRRAGLRIDAVFSSETYGAGFAEDLSRRQGHPVASVCVDASRARVPVSGTQVRADVHAHRHLLAGIVYASFVERVALLGGESTGKTTLAAALAGELRTSWVAEHGREIWIQRNGRLEFDDLIAIARAQVRREEEAAVAPATCRFVVCDTTPLTTLYYCLELFGRAEPELRALAARPYPHTVLCGDEFPFVQDGTRRTVEFRSQQQAWYRRELADRRYLEATGSLTQRLCAIAAALRG